MMLGAVPVTAQTKAKQNTVEQKLMALIRRAVLAQSVFDSASLEKIYASDYVEVSPVGEIDPREKAIGFYRPQTKKEGGEAKTIAAAEEISVRSYGDFAVVIARISFSQTGNEFASRPLASFRATYVCRREKGVWKIASAQATAIKPPRPQPTK